MSYLYRLAAAFALLLVALGGLSLAHIGTFTPTNPTTIDHLWNWKSIKTAPNAQPQDLELIMRVRAEPLWLDNGTAGDPYPGPIRSGYGEDRAITGNVVPPSTVAKVGMTLQLLDLRSLGVPLHHRPTPLCINGSMTSQEDQFHIYSPLEGISLRRPPMVHETGWSNGEYPLISLVTMDGTYYYTHTLLLQARDFVGAHPQRFLEPVRADHMKAGERAPMNRRPRQRDVPHEQDVEE